MRGGGVGRNITMEAALVSFSDSVPCRLAGEVNALLPVLQMLLQLSPEEVSNP